MKNPVGTDQIITQNTTSTESETCASGKQLSAGFELRNGGETPVAVELTEEWMKTKAGGKLLEPAPIVNQEPIEDPEPTPRRKQSTAPHKSRANSKVEPQPAEKSLDELTQIGGTRYRMTAEYLNLLDEEAEKFNFLIIYEAKGTPKKGKTIPLMGTLDQHWDALVRHNAEGAGIFVTVQETDLKGRKTENILRPRCLFKEDDRGGTPTLPLEPHWVVDTSPGKCHEYLCLDESFPLDAWLPIQQRLVDDYCSDPNAKDLSRVLRVPGFYHTKDPDNLHLVRIRADSISGAQPYSHAEVSKALPPVDRKPVDAASFKSCPGVGDINELTSALAFIDPDGEYEDWILIMMAVHHASGGSQEGYQLVDTWSQGALSPNHTGAKYPSDPEVIRYRWQNFSTDGNVTGTRTDKTIYRLARQAGWKGPMYSSLEAKVHKALKNRILTRDNLVTKLAGLFFKFNVKGLDQSTLLTLVLEAFMLKGNKGAAMRDIKEQLKVLRRKYRDREQKRYAGRTYRHNQIIDAYSFPYLIVSENGEVTIKNVHENLEHLLISYRVDASYDVISRTAEMVIPEQPYTGDLKYEAQFQSIRSLCAKVGAPLNMVDYLPTILMNNQINPVLDWVTSKPWDGEDRVTQLAKTVKTADDALFLRVLKIWLVQCIAALDGCENTPNTNAIPKYECVLVFQGRQGVKKTTFIYSLLPEELQNYILVGATLDTKDKDSVKLVITHWLVELGELDSTFKKSEISDLKAFMSREVDKFRPPYHRVESTFPRRTSFFASVNELEFLRDNTGNRRYLPVAVKSIAPHNLDLQQLWAQVYHQYRKGAQWWPNEQLARDLEQVTEKHRERSGIEDLMDSKFDMGSPDSGSFCSNLEIRKILEIRPEDDARFRKAGAYFNSRGFTTFKVKGVKNREHGRRLTLLDSRADPEDLQIH